MLRLGSAIALAAAVLGLQACTYAGYGDGGPAYAYQGEDYGGLAGYGADRLDPWLAETPEGQQIVRLGFEAAADGWVDEATADRINIWFRRYADTDHDLRLTDDEIRVALIQASRDHQAY